MIQHIVLFTPRETLSPAERHGFAEATLSCLRQSADIGRCSVGRRVDIDAGYDRSFGDRTYEYAAVLEFHDSAALIRYLNSEEHGRLGKLFWETCENTVVTEVQTVDLESRSAVDNLV